MIKFRRTIAIVMLALFACQSVMAGFGEHHAISSNGDAVDAMHFGVGDHLADTNADPDQPGSQDFMDTNCCHAHGHCHVLAVVGLVANVSISPGPSLVSSLTRSYQSLYLNTLLRPPASV